MLRDAKDYVDAKEFIKRIFEEERVNYLKAQKKQDDINNKETNKKHVSRLYI